MDVPAVDRARKCLIDRERVRTCAGLATLKKDRRSFFNSLLVKLRVDGSLAVHSQNALPVGNLIAPAPSY